MRCGEHAIDHVDDRFARARATARARHDVRATWLTALSRRRHRVARDEDRVTEARALALELGGERRVIGRVIEREAALELGIRDRLA